MCELSESDLDRHFANQLRMMGDVYTNIGPQDLEVSQQWLELFQQAKLPDKYARNCLMLLLYSQLKETGHLGKPFLDLENMRLRLDDVLSEYDGKMEKDHESVVGEEEAGETDTNASSYGGGSSRCCCPLDVVSVDTGSERLHPDIQCVQQANLALLNEIALLHTKTLETETLYRCRHQMLDKKLAEKPKLGKMEFCQQRIWQASIQAIDRLNDWSGSTSPLDFLASILGPFLRNEPHMSSQISKLDRYFELMLDRMVLQACERREGNVRILYEQLFKQMRETQRVKEEQMQRTQEALKQEFKKLRVLSEDLKHRDELIWKHQEIATMAATGEMCQPSAEERSSPRTTCEVCQGLKCSPKSQAKLKTAIRRARAKCQFAEELEKFTEGLSDLSERKW
ncbi:hypothetical protein KR009_000737 [Drosophila setifemur]|nr:hypothetical protein KR009_000737 [Drosophila setifemur]